MGVNEVMRVYRNTYYLIEYILLRTNVIKFQWQILSQEAEMLCLTGDLSFTFIKIYDILRVKEALIKSVYCAMQCVIFNPITSFGLFTFCEVKKVKIFRRIFLDKLQVSQPHPISTMQSLN
jgi:hypothetical protein